jgi:peptide/nickel transport system substrate-binding protein
LVATIRNEPKSYNRFVSAAAPEELLSLLTQATLVRVNRVTGAVEPRLAESWTQSADGLTWTLKLRDGVTFSDGKPFTSADVLFSLEALYDERAATELASSVRIGGKPLAASALDPRTVVVVFPGPYGPGLSILDSLPILPSHKLSEPLKSGTFREAWSMATPPAEIAGLGPFVVESYTAGQQMRLVRNPRFWMRDARGQQLPYLDRLELQFVPDQNAELLRLQAGGIDLTNGAVRAEDLSALQPLATSGVLTLVPVGVAINSSALWFNLTPGAKVAAGRSWLQRAELRQAISYAVDRREIVNKVYLGAGEPLWGPVTPGHGEWYVADLPRTEHDQTRARALLGAIGLSDRNGDGLVDDASGKTARFSLLTQKGNTAREKTCAILQEQLRQVGLTVDVVPTDFGSLVDRYGARDYEAMYFGVETNSPDPARSLDFWMSSGSFHYWNAQQLKPATEWESRIDDLMRRQSTTLDAKARHDLFAEAQRVLAAALPTLHFAAPRVTLAMSARVRGATPSVLQPPILWNAETLSVAPGSPGGTARR